jgi:H+-transporting ATPase
MSNKKSDRKQEKWKSPREIIDKLSSDTESGLSEAEAQKRLDKYGKNDIVEKKTSPITKFLSNFWGPIPWMIEALCILAAISHHWEDFFVMLALLLINVVISFWDEHNADRSIQALKDTLSSTAGVVRDGKQQKIDPSELGPGNYPDYLHSNRGVWILPLSTHGMARDCYSLELCPVLDVYT